VKYRVVPWDSAPLFLIFGCLGGWDFGPSEFLGYLAGWDFEEISSSSECLGGWYWTIFQLDSSSTLIRKLRIFVRGTLSFLLPIAPGQLLNSDHLRFFGIVVFVILSLQTMCTNV
jgi:hypothetical protein